MRTEDKKLLYKNSAFICAFALIFICYCYIGSRLIESSEISKTTSVEIIKEKKVLVIDAGHGGEDGGAIGVNGVLEKDLNLAIPKDLWGYAHHLFIFHGRRTCHSRKPNCKECKLQDFCTYFRGRDE